MAIDIPAKLQQSKLYFANLMDKYVDTYVFGISVSDCASDKTEYAYTLIEALEYQMQKGLGIDNATTLSIYEKLDCITPIYNTPVTIDESLLTPISNNPISGLVVYFSEILGNPYDNFNLSTALGAKFNNPTGLSTEYLDGLGDPQPFPAIPDQTFTVDIPVSLSNGKTLGKYLTGQTVPAIGKTAQEVFLDIAIEALNPTVTLTSSTTISFNQTAISNVLNFSYVINSLGATVSTAVLQWRRNNTGSWTTLSSSTTTPNSFTHTLTDTAFNTAPFNYQYIVTDSASGTATATFNITPAAYVAPSVSLSALAVTITSPETNATREKGNISTNLSGSVTRNSVNVLMTSYTLQYSLNNSTWVDIGLAVSLSGSSQSIPITNHNDVLLYNADVIYYRVKVIDSYQTYLSSFSTGGNTSVSFYYLIFYGPSASAPTTSSNVRALGTRQFVPSLSNPFNLLTGSTYNIFTAAMPATLSISSVIDLDALNANITANYILSTFNVLDYFGTFVSYHVYTLTNATPYSESHRHQITRI